MPELQEVVTTKRAIFAAYNGPVFEGHDVRSHCGLRQCANPEHMEQVESTHPNKAKALCLPNDFEALLMPTTYQPAEKVPTLPPGLTIHLIGVVKFLSRRKNTLAEIRTATKLPLDEIMKIRGGMYDDAVKNTQGASAANKLKKAVRVAKSAADIPRDAIPQAGPRAVGPEEPSTEDVPEATEEELMWLKQLGRG